MVEIKKTMVEMDGFDRLPDSLILQIFNAVSDVKTLIRCRSVSKRFNSLVLQADSLLLKVDCVISPESDSPSLLSTLLLTFLGSLLKSLHDLFTSDYKPSPTCFQTSPAQILSRFHRIRHLHIELPAGDLLLEKNVKIKWRAEFGKELRSCVILGFRDGGGNGFSDTEADFARALKTRVFWTINALIAASARHYLLKEVVKDHEEMERLVLKDREGEGVVVMDKEGLLECRTEDTAVREWERRRTGVPSVRMRMRHEHRVELKSGELVRSAMLVIVRPCGGGGGYDGSGSDMEDAELAISAFGGGIYGEIVGVLLKRKSYFLEMNSF